MTKQTSDRRAMPCLLTKPPNKRKPRSSRSTRKSSITNLSDYVRKNLEDVLNELLDAEEDRLCHAKRYERNAERASTRAGSYKRNFDTTSGKVTLNIPVSFHSKCKVWGQRTDTVQQFKEPGQRSVPRIF